ncbi:hypothetical protein ACWD3I_46170 [Streptomyces sp. NPDC002817]
MDRIAPAPAERMVLPERLPGLTPAEQFIENAISADELDDALTAR